MAADLYTIFPAVNSDYEFPPEVRNAFLMSSDVRTAIDNRADAKVQAGVTAVTDVRQYQNYRWTNAAARAAQIGMRTYDRGTQLDTGVEYVFVNGSWQVYGSDPSLVTPFMNPRQYQNYRWVDEGARNAQTGMRIYDRGIQIDTGVEFQYNGNAWQQYISPATPTNDAGRLTSGILPSARLNNVLQAFTGGDAYAPVSGENINGDWNNVLGIGMYRVYGGADNTNSPPGAYLFGTLILFGAGAQIGSRTQVYYSHNGQCYYRTAWNGNDWGGWKYVATNTDLENLQNQINNRYTKAEIDNGFGARDNRLNALEANNGSGWTTSGGWSLNRANFTRAGRVLTMDLSVKRTGGAIASGNIANIKIGDVSGGYGNAGYVALASGPGGIVSSFYLLGTAVYIAATSASIANNAEVTCGGTWVMS